MLLQYKVSLSLESDCLSFSKEADLQSLERTITDKLQTESDRAVLKSKLAV